MSAVIDIAVEIASWALLSLGALFCVVGGVGLVRFPGFYARVHAAGITDTLGAGLLLGGLMLQGGFTQVTVKLAIVLAFLLLTSPTATHALVKAAYGHDVRLDLEVPSRPLEPGEDPWAGSPPPTAGGGATLVD